MCDCYALSAAACLCVPQKGVQFLKMQRARRPDTLIFKSKHDRTSRQRIDKVNFNGLPVCRWLLAVDEGNQQGRRLFIQFHPTQVGVCPDFQQALERELMVGTPFFSKGRKRKNRHHGGQQQVFHWIAFLLYEFIENVGLEAQQHQGTDKSRRQSPANE